MAHKYHIPPPKAMLERLGYHNYMAKQKTLPDANQLAKLIADLATGYTKKDDPYQGKNPLAVELGRLGGQKGGKARAESLSPKRRREIAKQAANARWGKER